MEAPQEIRKLLDGSIIIAYARLSVGLTSAIGETHLVVVDGQLRLFTRDSIMGDFTQPALDGDLNPTLTAGTFNDELVLTLADGTTATLSVSSFDRDPVVKVLDSLSDPNTVEQAPAPENSPEPISAPEAEPVTASEPDPLSFVEEAPVPVGIAQSVSTSESEPETVSHPHGHKQTGPNNHQLEDDKNDAKPDKEGVVWYRSADPGCLGCLLQLVLFSGSIYAFVLLHPIALDNLWELAGWGHVEHSGFLWVVTKIMSIIAGIYFGGRLFGLIGKYAEAKLLGGGVSFKGFEMKAYGPKGATQQSFDLKRPITWACDWEDDTKDSEEERERGINVQIRIAQDGKIAVLKSSIRAKRPNFLVKNMSYSAHKTLEPDEAAVALDSRKLRQVIRRLAKIVGWD